MERELLIALLAGLGGMIGWGFADFFAKKTIDRLGDIQTLFWSQFIGIGPLAILIIWSPPITAKSMDWAWVVILGAWSGLSYIPTYVAFGKGKVSLHSPLFATYAVVVTILSALLLGERIPGMRQIAFVTVFFGVLLITSNPADVMQLLRRKERSGNSVAGVKEILLAICLYSVWLVALDRFLSGRPWVPFLLGIRVFSAASLYVYARATGRRLTVREANLWPYLLLIGCFDVGAFASVAAGFSHSPYVSVVAMLSGAFSLPTIVLARLFLRERPSILQTVGSFVILLGIVLLYVL